MGSSRRGQPYRKLTTTLWYCRVPGTASPTPRNTSTTSAQTTKTKHCWKKHQGKRAKGLYTEVGGPARPECLDQSVLAKPAWIKANVPAAQGAHARRASSDTSSSWAGSAEVWITTKVIVFPVWFRPFGDAPKMPNVGPEVNFRNSSEKPHPECET